MEINKESIIKYTIRMQEGGRIREPAKRNTEQIKPYLPTFYGPAKEPCEYGDCSEWATSTTANTYGIARNELNPEDAWYRRAAILKGGGVEVYNKDNKTGGLDSLQLGDAVTMRGSMNRAGFTSKTGLPMEDNYNNGHIGVVIGKAQNTGEPLVRHRTKDVIKTDTLNAAGIARMGIKSIVRPKAIIGQSPVSGDYYMPSEDSSPINVRPENHTPEVIKQGSLTGGWEEKAKLFGAALNDAGNFTQKLRVSGDELEVLKSIGVGLFGSESRFDTSKKRPLKKIAKDILYSLGLTKTSPSLGPTQLKYEDSIKNADGTTTPLKKLFDSEQIHPSNFENYNTSAKATILKLGHMYNKLKKQSTYDSEKGTIDGNIPIEHALIDNWKYGSLTKARKEWLKKGDSSYVKGVLDNMQILNNGKTVFPKILNEAVVTRSR